ncbi:MAG TPA: bifunctional demethylmenaquinone methyltransferase/2-methoxy-6-polyprenyl-1,4-benzoquinol methylase UbiE [Tepidisphaeraceae bacterium]|nr:bifunctional demethylmenaquinone methyltransferase/2-methoxy-6-polyprenyl-1,4-benzoquinol methylase UbiE [Tepidisphaeraceae bacterium]
MPDAAQHSAPSSSPTAAGAAASPAWDDSLLANPHAVADKRRRVRQMFAAIAPSYDLNNRLHSLWQDQRWRKKAVSLAELKPLDEVIDVACGTGDLSLAFAKALDQLRELRMPHQGVAGNVLGVDFTFEMLPIANRKSKATNCKFVNGDAQSLPLPDASADVASIAFGIRNVQDPAAAVREFHRVLRPGGRVIVLEFSLPTNPLLRGLYNFYFRQVLPRTATLISGDKTGAYKYLPQSVNTFIGRQQMMRMLADAGFGQIEQFPMTFGVCVCYRGVKR